MPDIDTATISAAAGYALRDNIVLPPEGGDSGATRLPATTEASAEQDIKDHSTDSITQEQHVTAVTVSVTRADQ